MLTAITPNTRSFTQRKAVYDFVKKVRFRRNVRTLSRFVRDEQLIRAVPEERATPFAFGLLCRYALAADSSCLFQARCH